MDGWEYRWALPKGTRNAWLLRQLSHSCVCLGAGIRTGTEVKMGSANKMERFINTLDNYLQASQWQRVWGLYWGGPASGAAS